MKTSSVRLPRRIGRLLLLLLLLLLVVVVVVVATCEGGGVDVAQQRFRSCSRPSFFRNRQCLSSTLASWRRQLVQRNNYIFILISSFRGGYNSNNNKNETTNNKAKNKNSNNKNASSINENHHRTRFNRNSQRWSLLSDNKILASNETHVTVQIDPPNNGRSRPYQLGVVEASATAATSTTTNTTTATATMELSDVIPRTDLSRPGRFVHIVTTAALPWLTGTAVNPLLRAAYLHHYLTHVVNNNNNKNPAFLQNGQPWVTLVIPWLELPEDQMEVYDRVFRDPQDQEDYIRDWLRQRSTPHGKEDLDKDATTTRLALRGAADPTTGIAIHFYPARYHHGFRSIFPMGDILDSLIINNSKNNNKNTTMDVCILEEPEHLNWFRTPTAMSASVDDNNEEQDADTSLSSSSSSSSWMDRFQYVIGVVHTNYKEFASLHFSGLWSAPAVAMFSSAMVRAYCHRVIKLSPALQSYAPEKECVSNVHGVREDFLIPSSSSSLSHKSEEASYNNDNQKTGTTADVYFIGKLLWAKGFDILLELQDAYKAYAGEYFPIDIYGSGPDQNDIVKAFHGRRYRRPRRGQQEDTAGSMDKTKDNDTARQRTENYDADNQTNRESFPDIIAKAFSYVEDASEGWNSTLLKKRLKHTAREKVGAWKRNILSTVDELPKSFRELRKTPIPATFPGRVDHASLHGRYKIFVNPSLSEVLCTTTAEALAMGKFVIIPQHPSNEFFLQFPNCLAYRNKVEFIANLSWALSHEPEPLTKEQRKMFTWEAATERFVAAAAVTWSEAIEREKLGLHRLDERIAWLHGEMGKGQRGDLLRRMLGAGPVSNQSLYQKYRERGISTDKSGDTRHGTEDEDAEQDDDDVVVDVEVLQDDFDRIVGDIRDEINDVVSYMRTSMDRLRRMLGAGIITSYSDTDKGGNEQEEDISSDDSNEEDEQDDKEDEEVVEVEELDDDFDRIWRDIREKINDFVSYVRTAMENY